MRGNSGNSEPVAASCQLACAATRGVFHGFPLWTVLALLAILLSKTDAGEPTATAQSAENNADKGHARPRSKDILKQWTELLARREKLLRAVSQIEDEFNAAKTFEAKQKVQANFEKLRAEFETEINPGLAQLASSLHKLDPTDPVAAQFLIGKLLPNENQETVSDGNYAEIITLVSGLTRSDKESQSIVENILRILLQQWRQSQAAPLLDKLAAAKDVNPRILTLDGMAHLYLGDFEKAAELTTRAVAAGAISPDVVDFQRVCQEYVGYWQREQELRAAEAKADDLPRVLLKTSKGDIVVELFENEAPNTVANFISLVEARKYDGVKFHRVIPGFMAQGGDPKTLDKDPNNDGQGGPGYRIACECYSENARMHFQGSLSMAHAGKDTGGSQFFITHAPTAHLNWAEGKQGSSHTVFGRVINGLDVALALRKGDKIESAKVIRKRDKAYVPVKVADRPAGGKRK
jgi:cyclophilin family peptidyl-prolyl cis-trans isomerase